MILALVLTIIIEWVVMWLLTHSVAMCKYNLYCNMVTNPILNLILSGVMYFLSEKMMLGASECYFIPLIILEPAVVFSEMAIYRLITGKRKKECFKLSLLTNLVSALAGILWFLVQNCLVI